MARARNIKPALFDNDELAENDPLGRLLFIGLWTIADCNGNLEWRPKKVKKQILAYDECCIDTLAINLDKSGFVRFYSVEGKIHLNIPNFAKHQNPHKNERDKGTEIPAYTNEARQAVDLKGLTINPDKSGLKRNSSDSNPADSLNLIPDSLNLIPDSLNLIPDSLNLIPDSMIKDNASANLPYQIFNYWKEVMKKNGSSKFTAGRMKKVQDRIKDGYTAEQIKQAILGCSKTPHNNGTDPKGNGQKFDDLSLICRSGEHIERFMENASLGPVNDMNNIGDNFEPPEGWK